MTDSRTYHMIMKRADACNQRLADQTNQDGTEAIDTVDDFKVDSAVND